MLKDLQKLRLQPSVHDVAPLIVQRSLYVTFASKALPKRVGKQNKLTAWLKQPQPAQLSTSKDSEGPSDGPGSMQQLPSANLKRPIPFPVSASTAKLVSYLRVPNA